MIMSIIKRNGVFQFSTDNISYALEAKKIISKVNSDKGASSQNSGVRPITKVETKSISKKTFLFDLLYFKQDVV